MTKMVKNLASKDRKPYAWAMVAMIGEVHDPNRRVASILRGVSVGLVAACVAACVAAFALQNAYRYAFPCALLLSFLAGPTSLVSAFINGARTLGLAKAQRLNASLGTVIGEELIILAGLLAAMFAALFYLMLGGLGHI